MRERMKCSENMNETNSRLETCRTRYNNVITKIIRSIQQDGLVS